MEAAAYPQPWGRQAVWTPGCGGLLLFVWLGVEQEVGKPWSTVVLVALDCCLHTITRRNVRSQGFVWLTCVDHSPSLRKGRAGQAGAEECCLLPFLDVTASYPGIALPTVAWAFASMTDGERSGQQACLGAAGRLTVPLLSTRSVSCLMVKSVL